MRQLNPQQIADRYVAGMQGATTRYKEGIDAVTQSPPQQAALALDRAKAAYIQSIDSGRMAARLNSVSLETWKTLAKTKGANNLAGGATAARSKVALYWQNQGPAIAALQARIAAMPKGSIADSIARSNAWIQGMADLKAQRTS